MIERRFLPLPGLSPLEAEMLWHGMIGFGNRRPPVRHVDRPSHAGIGGSQAPSAALRFKVADWLNSMLKWARFVHMPLRVLFRASLDRAGGEPQDADLPKTPGVFVRWADVIRGAHRARRQDDPESASQKAA
jgi:hypothetical protein